MRSFLGWFKNSTRIKRWMFMIIVGMVLTSYGFTKLLVSEELGANDLAEIIGSFVVRIYFVYCRTY